MQRLSICELLNARLWRILRFSPLITPPLEYGAWPALTPPRGTSYCLGYLSLYFVFLILGFTQLFALDPTTSQKMGITHIVLFQFKPAVTTATIKEVGL